MNEKEKQRFEEEMAIRALSPKTIKAYKVSLKSFFDFYKGRAAKALDIPEIKTFQRHLLEKKYSPNTVNRHLTAIRVFYHWVYDRRHYTSENLPRAKTQKNQPVVLSRQEIKRMIESVNKYFYKAILMTLYSTGLRNEEVRKLKVTDIDRERMVIHLKQGKGKKDRQALLSPVTLEYLEKYWVKERKHLNTESEYLFIPSKNNRDGNLNKILSHSALGYIIKVAAREAGVKKKSRLIPSGTPLQFIY